MPTVKSWIMFPEILVRNRTPYGQSLQKMTVANLACLCSVSTIRPPDGKLQAVWRRFTPEVWDQYHELCNGSSKLPLPWHRIFLGQLIKTFSYYWCRRFCTAFTKALHWSLSTTAETISSKMHCRERGVGSRAHCYMHLKTKKLTFIV